MKLTTLALLSAALLAPALTSHAATAIQPTGTFKETLTADSTKTPSVTTSGELKVSTDIHPANASYLSLDFLNVTNFTGYAVSELLIHITHYSTGTLVSGSQVTTNLIRIPYVKGKTSYTITHPQLGWKPFTVKFATVAGVKSTMTLSFDTDNSGNNALSFLTGDLIFNDFVSGAKVGEFGSGNYNTDYAFYVEAVGTGIAPATASLLQLYVPGYAQVISRKVVTNSKFTLKGSGTVRSEYN